MHHLQAYVLCVIIKREIFLLVQHLSSSGLAVYSSLYQVEALAGQLDGSVAAFADTNFNVVKDQASVSRGDLNHNNLTVCNACFFCFSSADVQMTFCNDNAFSQFYFTSRAYQFAWSAASQITGKSYRSIQTKASCIGSGKLNLRFGTEWAKDADVSLRFLWANNSYFFIGSKLTFDGQFFFYSQLSVCTKQGCKVLSTMATITIMTPNHTLKGVLRILNSRTIVFLSVNYLSLNSVRLYPGINSVTAITEKDDGHMWIGTSAGLYLLDKESGRFQ